MEHCAWLLYKDECVLIRLLGWLLYYGIYLNLVCRNIMQKSLQLPVSLIVNFEC